MWKQRTAQDSEMKWIIATNIITVNIFVFNVALTFACKKAESIHIMNNCPSIVSLIFASFLFSTSQKIVAVVLTSYFERLTQCFLDRQRVHRGGSRDKDVTDHCSTRSTGKCSTRVRSVPTSITSAWRETGSTRGGRATGINFTNPTLQLID